MSKYAYLGPVGTFSEVALTQISKATDERIPFSNITSALNAVRSGEVIGALVPIENSVEGFVARTLDELVEGDPLVIVAETTLPVRFALIAHPNASLNSIETISTHPHAEAQCRTFIAEKLPHADVIAASSTAAAVESISKSQSKSIAAIGSVEAAKKYNLSVLAEDIGDNKEAITRFVLVTKPGNISNSTGHDRTSLAIFIGADHAGALLEILTEFAVRGVNLSFIQSRPTGKGLGSYHFLVDLEGHVSDSRVGDAMTGLKRICQDVQFLGSYERADKVKVDVTKSTSDKSFADSGDWLSKIRQGKAT